MADGAAPHDEGTRTLAAARDHARSQAGANEAGPGVTTFDLPDDVDGDLLWTEVIEPGDYASRRLPRGSVLRVEDTDGDACVQLLIHNAAQPAERLNVADTVKVQWQAYLAEGALLLSDMGRVLMTIVGDTSARHDCLCGASTRAANTARYGDGGVGAGTPNGRDLLALGIAKFGLSRRDVGPSVNLFKSVHVDGAGALHLDGGARPGTRVALRAELDVLVTLSNTPHPLDDRPEYASTPVRCVALRPAHVAQDSASRSTPERRRAFANTADYLIGVAS
jgi:urea carboxylase-associated protein 2